MIKGRMIRKLLTLFCMNEKPETLLSNGVNRADARAKVKKEK